MELHVVFAGNDLGNASDSGVFGNHPEQRKRLVQEKLKVLSHAKFHLVEPAADISLALCVHDEELVTYLKTAWDQWVAIWEENKSNRSFLELFGVPDTKEKNQGNVPSLVPLHIAPRGGLQRASKSILGQAGYFAVDHETPITSGLVDQLRSDMGIIAKVVSMVEKAVSKPEKCLIYAQVTHPGHHAHQDLIGGFCYLNNVAIAAKLLTKSLGDNSVAIVDVDYHAGNGTASIFFNDASIFVASLHADPDFEYPFNFGYADQTGEGDTTLNVPLPGQTSWSAYSAKLQNVFDAILKWNPNPKAILISLGLDTLQGDPVARPQSQMSLLPDDFAEMRKMFDASFPSTPLLVFQEGGYKLDDVPTAVANFLK